MLLRRYPRRSAVVLALMVSQAFFYNAIFFTYALVLTRFYGVADARVGLYIFPFAAGNVLGPLLLGPLFDRIGRRRDDRRDLRAVRRRLLALTGVGFLLGVARRDDADARLVGRVLPRVRGGELGLSDGERGVPAGDARPGDLDLLRGGHRRRRLRGAGAVRRADRDRQPRKRVHRLRDRRGADGRRRGDRLALRGGCGAQAAGAGRAAAVAGAAAPGGGAVIPREAGIGNTITTARSRPGSRPRSRRRSPAWRCAPARPARRAAASAGAPACRSGSPAGSRARPCTRR